MTPRPVRSALVATLAKQQESLRRSEDRYRDIVENCRDLICTHDMDGRLLSVNRAFKELLGYDEAQLLGHSIAEFLTPEIRPRFAGYLALLTRDGHASGLMNVLSASGEVRVLEYNNSLRCDGVAAPIGRALARDVTDRIHAEDQLRLAHDKLAQLAHKFEQVLDCAGEGIFSLDADGRTTGLNLSAARMLGWEVEELKGRVMHDLIHHTRADGTPYPYAECPIHAAFLCGTVHNMANEVFWRKDGSSFPVEYTSAPICDTDGKPVGVVVIFRDVTARMLAERQINLQTAALKAAANVIVITDRNGSIIWANPAFTRLYGYSAEEAVGKNPRLLKSGKHDRSFYEQMWQTVLSGQVWRGEIINKRKDGALCHEEMTITPVYDSDRQIDHFVAIKQDISERIRAQEELATAKLAAEAANRAKSDFLARMSHEIRTPMNGIIGMTELALDTELNPEQREFLDAVKMSADNLLTVINDILDFSKIEAQKLELDAVPFRLRDTLDDTMATLALRAQQKDLELACDISTEVPDGLVGDPGRLRQVLTNLIGNAIKFTSAGEIVMRVRVEDKAASSVRLLFSVRDTGVGIPPEKLGTIFQPFEQADGTITRRYGGTGLGLAIAKQLAELMGGALRVESEPGKGSTFSFSAQFAVGATAAVPAPSILRGLAALVVDDNETNRRILEKVLGAWGMNVTCADQACAALTAIRWAGHARQPFCLALVDAQMPVMDGFELIDALRKDAATASLPVIMMTSARQPGDAARCRELDVAAYLTKPVRQSQLLETILATLGATRALSPAPPVARQGLPEPKRSLRILLAEDNPINQTVARRVLEKWGHSVSTVNNGQEVLDVLESQSFDLVLMDVEMPVMDGLQATAALRTRERTNGRHVPVVAMTAHAMKGDKERCLAAGMDAYVSKPVQVKELYDVMEKLIALREPAAAESPASRDAVFDYACALKYAGDSEQLLFEVAAIFLEHTPQVLAEIHTAIATRDARALEFAAHTLKGSLSVFGAEAARASAEQLERLGRTGHADGAEAICAVLDTQLARLSAALAEMTAANSVTASHGTPRAQ